MAAYQKRVYHLKGTPYEIGYAAGQTLGARLARNVNRYITSLAPSRDLEKLHAGALPWLHALPRRFQEEFEGLAAGSKLPLARLAEWAYIEECRKSQCSGAVCRLDGHVWVARNNDTYVPELWGYVTIRETAGRIPTISFGMAGDV